MWGCAVWRVSEEHRKIVTILKNAPILDFHCAAGKLKWIEDTSSYNTTHDEASDGNQMPHVQSLRDFVSD